MKVRMIIECDGKDVGRFLDVMPQKATFTVTRTHEDPKPGPIGKMVMDQMSGSMTKVKKNRPARNETGVRMKDVILDELAKGPRRASELTKILVGAGFRRDSTSGRLWELINKDKTIRREAGVYYLNASTEQPHHA